MPTPTLPKLTDHTPFAPIASRMLELDLAYTTARKAKQAVAELCHQRDAGTFTGDIGRHGSGQSLDATYRKADQTVEDAKQARDDYYREVYRPAHKEAVAAVLPKVAGTWKAALVKASEACEQARAAIREAVELRESLRNADLFHLPLVDGLPACDPLGDPADEWSVLGKLRAAAR